MIFEFEDPSIRNAYFELWDAMDGTQPCLDEPDEWVENWTSRAIPPSIAEEKCAPCKDEIKKACLAYALLAGEEVGIWGGTTPEMRKEMRDEHPNV